MNLKIHRYPDKILITPAQKVVLDETFQLCTQVIPEMYNMCRNNKRKAVGLAAPQVGLSWQFLVVVTKNLNMYMINPEITEKSEEFTVGPEGCLSFPKTLTCKVPRRKEITVSYQTLDKEIHTRTFTDFEARVVQHEIDHLQGITMVDRQNL